jgi:hypothetical protein
MEKQTKILLGVGAVIAAYLILKPKKADEQILAVSTNLSNDGGKFNPLPAILKYNNKFTCPEGFMIGQKVDGLKFICKDAKNNYTDTIINLNYKEPRS